MNDIWNDLKLALTLILFIYTVNYLSGLSGSKKIGIVMAVIVAYLTFYSHWELLVLILIVFFAYPFFGGFAKALYGE